MIPVRDTIPSRRLPLVTGMLIALNAGVFLFELSLTPKELQHFFYLFGIVPARYSHPEWAALVGFPIDDYWPFFTSMFLHSGWAHIVGNMWTLWIFGDNVEDRMGHGRFLAFYLVTGLVAGLTHWLTNVDSTVPTVGASGAIAGVLGAYFLLFPRAQIVVMVPLLFVPFFFVVPAVTYLLVWIVTQFLGGALSGLRPDDVGGIAFWAHVGGFAAGVVLHRMFLIGRRDRGWHLDEYGIEGAWSTRR